MSGSVQLAGEQGPSVNVGQETIPLKLMAYLASVAAGPGG
jgi:hypothetical protein